jgi:hypothetical protein
MIGGAVVEAFAEEEPELLIASGASDIAVDITIHDSVRALFDRVGPVDAVASSPARFLTSSSLAKQPCGTSPKASLLSPTVRSVEAFVNAAAPRGLRLNVVSPQRRRADFDLGRARS